MSAVAPTAVLRPQPLNRFNAWRIGDQRSCPIAVSQESLADAIADVCQLCTHRDNFVIRENAGEVATLRFYVVKQKAAPRYVLVDHVTKRVHDLYADELLRMQVSAFVPVEPWRWSPGADAIGHRPTVIA